MSDSNSTPVKTCTSLRYASGWWVACLFALIVMPTEVWARPKNREARRHPSIWSRIAFTEESPDFVPPPPRDALDEDELTEDDEQNLNSELFEDVPSRPDKKHEPDVAEPLLGDVFEGDPGPVETLDGEVLFEEPVPHGELDPLPAQRDYFDPGINTDAYAPYTWQVMPSGLMYRSYLAGEKESRLSSVWMKDRTGRTVWENTLGARVGLLRYGTTGAYRPQGWQLDLEGAALARVLPGTESTMLEATDYRAGFQSTWAFDRWHIKAGYYHLSSHLGDEFVIANPLVHRFNYVRDSAVAGVTYEITDDWQTYGEFAYALGAEDGAKPVEFQYGLQYSPLVFGLQGAPFAAVNGHTREDFGYITSLNCQAGWQWRGTDSQRLLRAGLQYYTGPALQYSFPGKHDRLLGGGIWIDF